MLREWRRRLQRRVGSAQFDADLEAELQFHVETRADELEQDGLPRKAAMAQARKEFGSPARALEESREVWRFQTLEDLVTDIAYAARTISREPGFALTATLCLALGIGVNTTIFSAATEFLLTEATATHGGRLVGFRVAGNSHSEPLVVKFMQDAKPLDDIAAFREAQINWRNGDVSQVLFTIHCTPNFFETVGIPVAQGRGLMPGDENAAVITDKFWRSQLSQAEVIGRPLILNGQPHTIVGILPASHRTLIGFGYAPDLYVPATLRGDRQDALALIGHLPAGLNKAAARDRIKAAAAELDRVHPNPLYPYNADIRVSSLTGLDRMAGNEMIPLVAFFGMLLAVVWLVLLIACANVSSLLLARSAARTAEIATRAALGASRGRIVRQLLAESALLAIVGTALGLFVNLLLTRLFSQVQLPLPIPIQLNITPDWRLSIYAAMIAFGVTIAAGLLPALQAARSDMQRALANNQTRLTGRTWWRNALVAGQLAASVVLLTTAFLFLRNLQSSNKLDVRFDLRHTLLATATTIPERYQQDQSWLAFVDQTLDEVRALPGVEQAAFVHTMPFQDANKYGGLIWTEGEKTKMRGDVFMNWVSGGYFAAMQIPLLLGRDFTPADRDRKPSAVILNANLSRRLFGDGNPLGRRLFRPRGNETEELEVIGVAAESRYLTLGEEQPLAFYGVAGSGRRQKFSFVVRVRGNPAEYTKAVRTSLLQIDPTAAVEVKPLRDAMGFALLPSQVGALLLGAMGALGVLLAAVGLFGVLNYAVALRTREIGVRMALGAPRSQVLLLIGRDTVALVAGSIAIGSVIAYVVTRPLSMFLMPELRPGDPINYVTVAFVLAAVAALAAAGPTVRATRVDPLVALRYE